MCECINGDCLVMMRRCWLVIDLIVLLALLAGCRGTNPAAALDAAPRINPPASLPAKLQDFPAVSGRGADVPKDYEAVAENDSLRLYVRRASSAVIVEDKRSGRLWRSSPKDLANNKGTTTAWRRQIEIPVQAAFVDPERSQPKNAKVDTAVKLAFQPVQGGVEVTYNIPNIQIAWDVIYALKDDCLEAIVPEKSVAEKGVNGLVSIDLLTYFGASMDGDEGYIVYPDGSGALMDFKSPHPPEVQKISTVIYGTDASGGFASLNSSTFREQISMPVFGLVSAPKDSQELSGFVGMITQGDFDASLGIARSGKGINYNHVWTTLLFRRQGKFSLTGGQPAWLYQPDRISGDRVVRYCFLNGADASYVGMAARYRDFLVKERGAKRVTARADRASLPRMSLEFYMGVERKTWFLADMIQMTTFSQVQAVLDDLEKAGVTQVDLALWNWNRGGTGQKYPDRLPADPRLGGEQGLKALASDARRRGQKLFLWDDYMRALPGSSGVLPYLDASRGVDGLPIGDAETMYLINPQVALRSFAMRDVPKITGLGASGLALQSFGFLAIPDKNQRYPLSREGFAATYMQIASLSRQQMGAVAVDGANSYVIPYVDHLYNVPVDSTHFDLFSAAIPFYSIVAHGLAQYSNYPYNLVADGKLIFLRQVEYGATPYFLLTEASSAQLFRTINNSIYSSQYSFWRAEVIRQYQAVEKLAPLEGQFITGHARLAEDVFQTTYEDGTRVLVNYSAQPYAAGAVTVPAQDFMVIRGE